MSTQENTGHPKIICVKCGLVVLKKDAGTPRTLPGFSLPNHRGENEIVEDFVMVDDFFAFENVGFLNSVNEFKVSPKV